MNYDLFTPIFPALEGENVRLREVKSADVPALFNLLNESDIAKNYCPEEKFQTIEQVNYTYLFCAQANYKNMAQIQWLIEEKSSGTVIGVRDLFVDDARSPVTIQGFVGKAYRKRGYSKEAYKLILNYTKKNLVCGVLSNCSVENFPAIALLHTLGFKPHYTGLTHEGIRFIFLNDFSVERKRLSQESSVIRILVFCYMYLDGKNVIVSSGPPILRDGVLQKGYRVQLVARNTTAATPLGYFSRMMIFVSDGTVVMSDNDKTTYISYIDGRTDYASAWDFCWKECVVG